MIDDFWLSRPESLLGPETEADLEGMWENAEASDGGWVGAELPVEKWRVLCWLTDQKELLLHGSANPNIEVFEPRVPNDRSPDEFSKRTAVFAASDGVWPIFYAILDRSLPGLRFLNAALRFEPEPGRLTSMHYFFSVTDGVLRSGQWRDGVVYILPKEGFVQQPPYELNGHRVHEPHWASPKPVRPLARIRIGPLDFPFLDSIRGHDNDDIARRSAEDPHGFPWLTP
jgi:hypothetical protein